MLFAVGVGPGDPELMTLKAARILREVPVVAFFAKKGAIGIARSTAEKFISPTVECLPLYYPFTVEFSHRHTQYADGMKAFYDHSALQIAERLDSGKDVGLLCEGDPLLYGSYIYIHDRLSGRYATTIVPGVTGVSGCAARARTPLVSTDRVFSIIPATLSEDDLEARIRGTDALVLIKLGHNFAKARRVLIRAGRAMDATYVERGTMSNELIRPLIEKTDDRAAYFSLILVPGHGG
jgi:precorrin-2/cobalt-factor-2 C20-methyltransferase